MKLKILTIKFIKGIKMFQNNFGLNELNAFNELNGLDGDSVEY